MIKIIICAIILMCSSTIISHKQIIIEPIVHKNDALSLMLITTFIGFSLEILLCVTKNLDRSVWDDIIGIEHLGIYIALLGNILGLSMWAYSHFYPAVHKIQSLIKQKIIFRRHKKLFPRPQL